VPELLPEQRGLLAALVREGDRHVRIAVDAVLEVESRLRVAGDDVELHRPQATP
jgi:hypothetical protein